MSPAFNGISVVQHLKHGDAIKIYDGIIFDLLHRTATYAKELHRWSEFLSKFLMVVWKLSPLVNNRHMAILIHGNTQVTNYWIQWNFTYLKLKYLAAWIIRPRHLCILFNAHSVHGAHEQSSNTRLFERRSNHGMVPLQLDKQGSTILSTVISIVVVVYLPLHILDCTSERVESTAPGIK